jgi:hypothetical protein
LDRNRNVSRRLVVKHLQREDLLEINRPGGASIIELATLEEEFKEEWTLVSHTFGFYDIGVGRWAGILSMVFERPY